MDPIFHYWVKFDFNKVEYITHNENGFSAAYTEDCYIAVWKNNELGPNLLEGALVCLIVNQFDNIDQIQWIVNTDYLLIRNSDRIHIWNVFSNIEEETYLTTDPILYAKLISLGLLVVKSGGKFTLYAEDREITSLLTSDLIMDVEEGVMIYPSLFHVVEGEWVEEEPGMSWGERGLRRKLEGSNLIQIDGDLIQLDEEEIESISLPEGYRHLLDGCGIVIIRSYPDGYLIRTRDEGIFLWKSDFRDAIIITDNMQIIPSNTTTQYLIRGSTTEERMRVKNNTLIRENYFTKIHTSDILLDNIPPYLYLDTTQDLQFARFNQHYGFLWFPDHLKDYVFIDLLTQEGSIFADIGRTRNSYILVTHDANVLLEWNRGMQYPSGTLKAYDILHPNKEPDIIYQEEIISKRFDETDFFDEDDPGVKFPLIIPAWHEIELWIYTDRAIRSTRVSYSQYFMMLEHWSRSHSAALLEYPENIPEKEAFVLFGNLVLELENRKITFENIAPEWDFNADANLLAYYATDGYCYVIDTSNDYLLPKFSFPADLPYWLEFSDNGTYLVMLSFDIRQTSIRAHPKDGYRQNMETHFPYLSIIIVDLTKKESYKKSLRFPITLVNEKTSIKFHEDRILIYFPSYTNNSEEVVVMFDINQNQYHQVNGAEEYRLWMTYSKNSPFSKINKGKEFPVENHPEIKREYVMRPFSIYEGVLVRKEDNIPISMADINLQKQPQQSTANLYDLEDTSRLELPFYYEERFKPIHLDKEVISPKILRRLIPLPRIEQLPRNLTIDFDQLPRELDIRERIVKFIRNQLTNNIVHQEEGICFRYPDVGTYNEHVNELLKKYRLDRLT